MYSDLATSRTSQKHNKELGETEGRIATHVIEHDSRQLLASAT